MYDSILIMLIIFFSAFIPGVFLGLSLFKNTKLNLLEKLGLGFIFGLLLPALLLFLLSLIGVPFSFTLVLVSIIWWIIVGIVLCFKRGVFKNISFNLDKETIIKNKWKILGSLILLIFLFLAFYIRIQSLTPIYQELDPYWYMYGTEQILTEGSVPLVDNTAWYPLEEAGHRSIPVLHYLEASWYSLYTQGGEYNNIILSYICNFYPPLMALLLVFCSYLFIKLEFGMKWGLITAGLMTFLPATIMKMSAGVSESQPFSLFGMFFFLAILVLAFKEKKRLLYFLTGLSLSLVLLGGKSIAVLYILTAGFFMLYSLILFLEKDKKELKELMKNLVYLAIPILIVILIFYLYVGSSITNYLKSSDFILSIIPLIFSFILYTLLNKIEFNFKRKALFIILLLILGISLFYLPVVSDLVKGVGHGFLRQATYEVPLSRTVQEQAPAGNSFGQYLGFLGVKLDGIGLVFIPITYLTNSIIEIFDILFKNLFGLNQLDTTIKDNSLTLVFLFSTLIIGIYSIYKRYKIKEYSVIFLILILFIIPISYVGLNKAKYSIYLSLGIVLATVWTFAFISKLLNNMKNEKARTYIQYAVLGIACLFVLLMGFSFDQDNPTMAQSILSVSLETRYQDNPEALIPKFESICNKTGDKIVCDSLDADYFKNINNRYNQQLCMYSILSEEEITGELTPSKEKQIGISYRCSRIAPYWISSMEWISKNTPEDAKIISWWDYGHWLNFFGERDAVTRNDHNSVEMIGRTAFAYLHGSEQDLIDTMNDYSSEYALFDTELLLNGNQFGGKYGALNYLGCAYINETNVSKLPGQSKCEQNNLWINVFYPVEPSMLDICTISYERDLKGIFVSESNKKNSYCLGDNGMLYLNERDEIGELIPSGIFLMNQGQTTQNNKVYNVLTLLFMNRDIPFENTTINGWNNKRGTFYDSNLYKAIFLDHIEGFTKVYDNGNVKIYKLVPPFSVPTQTYEELCDEGICGVD